MVTRRYRVLLGLAMIVLIGSLSSSPSSQGGVTITFPTTIAAGPDYATEVLGDPWDFCNGEDISPNPDTRSGVSTFGFVSNPCRLTMTTTTADANFTILDRGLYDIAINPGRNGRNYPIDANRYRVLSFKLASTTSENPQVYWFQNPGNYPAGDGLGVRLTPPISGGTTQVLIKDLTQLGQFDSGAWSGLIRGLRLDPNNANVGGTHNYYWVRLTTPPGQSGTPGTQTISWSGGSGNATVTVRDNSDNTTLTIASNVAGTSFVWHYGVLAPGSYTLQVTRGASSGTKAFTINHPPSIEITNPSPTTGEDFATAVLGNAWDMSQSSDYQPIGSLGLTGVSFSSGQMHATNSSNDPAVGLLSYSNNGVPINTQKYRYLTYRFQVDGAYDLGEGSVARLFWGSATQFLDNTATTTKPIIVWPGMNSYTIDLATLTTAVDGGIETFGGAESWTAANKRFFRFDPHEFPQARQFHIDDIKLTAKPVSSGVFTIRFVGSDADGDAATVTLYYDTDTNPNNGKTLIVSNVPQSAGQYAWNSTGVPAGEYFVYAESSDSVQMTARYSTVPVLVASPPTTPTGFRIVQ
jgi:Kre9/KNH-like N-terminal Ig-like domain